MTVCNLSFSSKYGLNLASKTNYMTQHVNKLSPEEQNNLTEACDYLGKTVTNTKITQKDLPDCFNAEQLIKKPVLSPTEDVLKAAMTLLYAKFKEETDEFDKEITTQAIFNIDNFTREPNINIPPLKYPSPKEKVELSDLYNGDDYIPAKPVSQTTTFQRVAGALTGLLIASGLTIGVPQLIKQVNPPPHDNYITSIQNNAQQSENIIIGYDEYLKYTKDAFLESLQTYHESIDDTNRTYNNSSYKTDQNNYLEHMDKIVEATTQITNPNIKKAVFTALKSMNGRLIQLENANDRGNDILYRDEIYQKAHNKMDKIQNIMTDNSLDSKGIADKINEVANEIHYNL